MDEQEKQTLVSFFSFVSRLGMLVFLGGIALVFGFVLSSSYTAILTSWINTVSAWGGMVAGFGLGMVFVTELFENKLGLNKK